MSVNQELPSGKVYKINIGKYKKEVSYDSFRGLFPVTTEKQNRNRSYGYYAGIFKDYYTAQKAVEIIKMYGFEEAFIQAFENSEKKSTNEPALAIAESTEAAEIFESVESGITFSIQVGAFKRGIQSSTLTKFKNAAGNHDLNQYKNSKGYNVVAVGNFSSLEEAEKVRNELLKKGIKSAYIVAFQNKKRIPVKEAQQLISSGDLKSEISESLSDRNAE